MATTGGNRPLGFRDPESYARLRGILEKAGFSDRGVAEALGVNTARSLSGKDLAVLLRRTSGGTARDTFIRLFLLGVAVEAEALRRAIEPMTPDTWIEAGLIEAGLIEAGPVEPGPVEPAGRLVTARVQVLPLEGLVLAYDLPRRIEAADAEDYVMGIGSSTLTLANAMVRRPSRLSLDLGTGCGYLAFLAARHSTRVVAADRNARAIEFAAFNAALNELGNVECLEGDLFEPVRARQFDLVVSNPPFVISPETRYIYRDGGMQGDQFTQTIVRRVSEFLAEGGYCQILCNWAHVAGQDWRDRLAGWFAGTGCDAWVMRTDTLDAPSYAAKWIRHTERRRDDDFDRRLEQWIGYYEEAGIEAVSGGLITMRRRSGSPAHWLRLDDGPEKMLGPAGECIELAFALRDFLESHPEPEGWLSLRLRVSPDARLHQRFVPSPEGWQAVEGELRLERGLPYTGGVDPYVAALVARCDGQRPLGQLLDELARSVEQDVASLAPACLDIIRRLVERGFLLPPIPNSGVSTPPVSTPPVSTPQ